jgi:hypothetical protein
MNNIKLQSVFFNVKVRQKKCKYVHNKNTLHHMKMQKRSTTDLSRCNLYRIFNMLCLQEQEGSETQHAKSVLCNMQIDT